MVPWLSEMKPIFLQSPYQTDIENKTATIEEIEPDAELLPSSCSRVQSRGEVKARKALSKLGLVKVKGVNRVTIRRTGHPLLAISQPDVYKSLNSDTYIVFGEGQAEDANSLQSQLRAAEEVLKDTEEAPEVATSSGDAAEEDDEEIDEEGVNKTDIELVMTQANVSRSKAVKALKSHNNDIVNAIMELTIRSKRGGEKKPMTSTRFKGLIATQLAKITGGDAAVIARAIERPKVKGHGTFAFDVSGPIRSAAHIDQFLNFAVDQHQYTRETIQDVIQSEQAKQGHQSFLTSTPTSKSLLGSDRHAASVGYGTDSTVGKGQIVAIDYSSPNIAKPFHVGVLRLMAVGFGRYGDKTKLRQDPIKHLYNVYVKINRDITEDSDLDKLANQYFKQMEDGDPNVLLLWQEFRSLSIEVYKAMYKRLGIEFDVYSGESESAKYVPQAYELLRKKGLLKEQEDGAWVVDLKDHGFGVCALRRADGTTLYLTRDIAACLERRERFSFDRHLYMIGDDQNLHMKRLFKIMELAYADEAEVSTLPHWSRSLQHISFGKVQGMSTRKGKAVFLEDILDTAQSTMLEKMKENESKFEAIKESFQAQNDLKGSESDSNSISKEREEESVALVADQLGISAVVIQDFQARSSKGYEFNWKRMTESTGKTGIYLQYAHARLCGIEHKSGIHLNRNANTDLLTEPEAFELASMISMFPEVMLQTLQTLEPSMIVSYLFGLSHAISSANQVLQVKSAAEAGEQDLAEARMLLLWAARVSLSNGMRVLGLEPLERM
ncbi:Arginyl-tRNA synthetase [Modicella reniformis]|uniref:Nascent polypeptide-associated complex subunit beta n=1 Tax=Modicella reniformis TaxID=1440133 RepID=A0A9P6M9H3_9FUNG|nr:Arginyl-tRNA synthetase [Modicella reniformis]